MSSFCDCCSSLPEPIINLLLEEQTFSCSDTCGDFAYIDDPDNLSQTTTGFCGTKPVKYYPLNVGIRFRNLFEAVNYSPCPEEPSIGEAYFSGEYTYSRNFINGTQTCANTLQILSANACCPPGNFASATFFHSSPIFSCNLDENFQDWTPSNKIVSFLTISKWGNSRSKQNIRFKLSHSPTASCYLKIFFRTKDQVFYPDSNTPNRTSYTELEPYIWKASNVQYCVNNVQKPITDEVNKIFENQYRNIESSIELNLTESEKAGIQAVNELTNEWSTSLQEDYDETKNSTSLENTDSLWGEFPEDLTPPTPPINLSRGIGITIRRELEYKYSLIEGYEPPWP